MEAIRFTETIFKEKGKKGILTPDESGYYTLVLGALNTFNSAGEYYTAEGALSLFENSSQLMRRIKNGALYSELGHPKREPKMSLEEFYHRVITIDERNICAHIKEVTLDFNYGKNHPELNNPNLIAIIGKVKPAGAKAQALQLALENPSENAAFSVRGLTENKYKNGTVLRVLTNIITWDYVVEPGISIASKAHSPAVESKHYALEELEDTIIHKELMKKVINEEISFVGMESSRVLYEDLLSSLEKKQKRTSLLSW